MQCHRNTNCIPETATQILPGLLSPIVTAIQRLPARISQSNTNCHPKTVTQRLSPKDCYPRTATPKTASTDCLSIPIRKVIFVTNNIGFLVLPLKTLNNIGFLAFLLKALGPNPSMDRVDQLLALDLSIPINGGITDLL